MRTKPLLVVTALLALMLTLSAVADAAKLSFPGGGVKILVGAAPDSLDPQVGFTTQAADGDWIAYTPLLTYKHVSGPDGGTLIPGLANSLPLVSADRRTYEFTLRKGLFFSNGWPVKASDFAYTIKRAIRNEWGGKSFLTGNIVGAAAYDAGEAKSISGIVTNDKTGRITIRLTQPFGGFANILALPAAGLVPTGTPFKDLGHDPPPGVGPYVITEVNADGSYTMLRNPLFALMGIPGIPTGSVNKLSVAVTTDSAAEAEAVLANKADVLDAGDEIPQALLPTIEAQAGDRFARQPTASTFYFFLNTTRAPFDNLKARQAVNVALDRKFLTGLSAGGFMRESCFFLPDGIVGHPTGPCPYGEAPDIARARQLVEESGTAGTSVTVWGQERNPRRTYADYLTDMLNQIGFDADERIVEDGEYFSAIGDAANDPQIGFADWFQDFPNPSDFYLLMDGRAIQPTNNFNFSKVNDPFVQERLIPLSEAPATELGKFAGQWQSLDEYVAQQAYVAPFGQLAVAKFTSNRIDFGKAVVHVLFGNDYSTLRLKG